MIFTFLSSVFITLFFIIGGYAFMGYLEKMRMDMPLTWYCFGHVIVLAIAAAICFIFAVVFGIIIPECYVP